jgi:hypothetical protein
MATIFLFLKKFNKNLYQNFGQPYNNSGIAQGLALTQ